jgi:uncharacterized protein (DUF2147 family)
MGIMRQWFGFAAGMAWSVTGIPAASAQGQAAPPRTIDGIWINPHRSVAVRTGMCGGRLCGWIVWADAHAQDDARDGGVDRLVGTVLLEDYVPDGPDRWAGTVFVPDIGKRFDSRIEQSGADALTVKGCVLHGLFCKSQVWRRITAVPHG